MIRIGVMGNIGSGKSYIANRFGHPVFNADLEVAKIYKKNKEIFIKLNKVLPQQIKTFPIEKKEITKAILENKDNLGKIIKIVHKQIRKELRIFLNKNKNKKIVILDIPLLLENNLNKRSDVLIFIDCKGSDIKKKLAKRKNFNEKLFKRFKKIQYSSTYKRKKSNFIIKNDFTKKTAKNAVKNILKKILK